MIKRLEEERGIVLVLAMLLLLVLTLLGLSLLSATIFDNAISGNKRASDQAFYIAEGGINEFLGRFREGVTGEISDGAPSNPDWRLFIAIDEARAEGVGYDSGDSNHNFVKSLQDRLDFRVEVRHKVDPATNLVIIKNGAPVYIAKSHGFTEDKGNKVIEAEFIKSPGIDPPAAIYSKAPVYVKGSSTYIQGRDQCGSADKPGIITTTATIERSGNPTIDGLPSEITNSTLNLNLKEMVDYLRGYANFKYEYNENETLTGYFDSWGIPTSNGTERALQYTGPMNIVYFNMNGDKTLKLAGGSHGAGILIVDGNLDLNGSFSWYGVIIVTGALNYTGGGEKNVSGGVLAGDTANIQLDIGGNAGIMYCGEAIRKLKETIPPFKMTRWKEIF